jgi:hypothetical protein
MSPNIKNHFMVVRRGHSRSIAHHRNAWLVPIRITSDVGTTLAAGRANEPVLDIRQPNVIRPSITVHPDKRSAKSTAPRPRWQSIGDRRSSTSAISLGCTLATKLKNEKRDRPGTCMEWSARRRQHRLAWTLTVASSPAAVICTCKPRAQVFT